MLASPPQILRINSVAISKPSLTEFGSIPLSNLNFASVSKPRLEELFLTDDGKIHRFKGKKKELFNLMNDKSSHIKDYVNKNRINLKKMSDLARIVNYYNRI